jgi:hypothetical protein
MGTLVLTGDDQSFIISPPLCHLCYPPSLAESSLRMSQQLLINSLTGIGYYVDSIFFARRCVEDLRPHMESWYRELSESVEYVAKK